MPSTTKSFFFLPGFNVLRGEASDDGPGLGVFERHPMEVSSIDCATPPAQAEEKAFAEPGPRLFCKKPGSRIAGGNALVPPINVGLIEGRLIDANQGVFLGPGDCVVGVCQDDPCSKLVIVAEVMPPSEGRLRIDKLSVLNTQ